MAEINTRIMFKSRPTGWVAPENFEIVTAEAPEPGPDDVLVRNIYMSLDPYMRGRMNAGKSYISGFQLGEVMMAGVVGQVAASNNAAFAEGDYVNGMLGWENYSLVPGGKGLTKVDPSIAPLSYYLGVLGMPGMTAYVGLLDIGEPKEGDTVYISAASGAVGQIVGQIAKIKGCRVVGSAGSDDKVAYIRDELGFDAAFNYRTVESLDAGLRETCPDGIDVYFENVGGEMLDAVLNRINPFARIVACGMISQYNKEKPDGVHNLMSLVRCKAKIHGFIVSDHWDRLPAFLKDMGGWLKDGRVKYREDIAQGLENAPAAFIGMLKGENFGKQVVQITDDPTR